LREKRKKNYEKIIFNWIGGYERATHQAELTTKLKGVEIVRTFGFGHQVLTTKLNFINNTSSCLWACAENLTWYESPTYRILLFF